MKNLAMKVVDRLFIVACGPASPTDREWADYLQLVACQGVEQTRQIVSTVGGVPTVVQRRKLAALLEGRVVPIAVVSGNARGSTTVTAISWFNRRVRAFHATSAGLRGALVYLGIPTVRADLIERELHRLRVEVDEGRETRGETRSRRARAS
jgi:hypothetical protein